MASARAYISALNKVIGFLAAKERADAASALQSSDDDGVVRETVAA